MNPERLLEQLRQSELFSPEFPSRRRYTHAEWALLPEDARRAAHESASLAIQRVSTWRALENVVRALGDARYEPAIPALAELWAGCVLVPVRTAAGHALRAIASPSARAALESLIEDSDLLSVSLAVRAVFESGADAAFERFVPYFEPERLQRPGGAVIPGAVLATFCPSAYRGDTPLWTQPEAPAWFERDRRWMDLCLRLRRDDTLGEIARRALRYADRGVVQAALEQARRHEPSRPTALRSAATGDLVARYLRGEHEAVWHELRAHEAIAGDLREEALEVARATMRRVARAADVVATRLAERGWRSLSGALRTPPAAADAAVLARLAATTGAPLPPSLVAFWEIVGGIDLVWDYNGEDAAPSLGVDLAMEEMDPLAIDPPGVAPYLLEDWDEQRRGVDPELVEPFQLELAPDRLHKANISGGPPYGLELPFAGADPVFANEEHGLPFVEYLRLCFRWAGFPRLERHRDRADVVTFVTKMTERIDPF